MNHLHIDNPTDSVVAGILNIIVLILCFFTTLVVTLWISFYLWCLILTIFDVTICLFVIIYVSFHLCENADLPLLHHYNNTDNQFSAHCGWDHNSHFNNVDLLLQSFNNHCSLTLDKVAPFEVRFKAVYNTSLWVTGAVQQPETSATDLHEASGLEVHCLCAFVICVSEKVAARAIIKNNQLLLLLFIHEQQNSLHCYRNILSQI